MLAVLIKTLEKRFSNHKTDKKCSLYKYVNDDWDNWFIELYENYPCKNKYILEKREGKCNGKLQILISIAGRSKKQYRQDNVEKLLEKQKQHYKKIVMRF
jgi:hypothetical protein